MISWCYQLSYQLQMEKMRCANVCSSNKTIIELWYIVLRIIRVWLLQKKKYLFSSPISKSEFEDRRKHVVRSPAHEFRKQNQTRPTVQCQMKTWTHADPMRTWDGPLTWCSFRFWMFASKELLCWLINSLLEKALSVGYLENSFYVILNSNFSKAIWRRTCS